MEGHCSHCSLLGSEQRMVRKGAPRTLVACKTRTTGALLRGLANLVPNKHAVIVGHFLPGPPIPTETLRRRTPNPRRSAHEITGCSVASGYWDARIGRNERRAIGLTRRERKVGKRVTQAGQGITQARSWCLGLLFRLLLRCSCPQYKGRKHSRKPSTFGMPLCQQRRRYRQPHSTSYRTGNRPRNSGRRWFVGFACRKTLPPTFVPRDSAALREFSKGEDQRAIVGPSTSIVCTKHVIINRQEQNLWST